MLESVAVIGPSATSLRAEPISRPTTQTLALQLRTNKKQLEKKLDFAQKLFLGS